MTWLIRLITLTTLLVFTNMATAETAQKQELHKSDITGIKIVSSVYNKIHLFLTDQNNATYRMSMLNQNQAQEVLNRFKSDSSLIIKTTPGEGKNSYNIVDWR